MKIKFENIGAVKEATIDLSKKLNIFCGSNNTGKTYLAYCIYSINKLAINNIIFNFLSKESNEIFEQGKASFDLFSIYIKHKNQIKEGLELAFLNDLPNTFGLDFENKSKIFPKAVAKFEFDDDSVVESAIRFDSIKYRIGFGKEIMLEFNKEENSLKMDLFLTLSEHVIDSTSKTFILSVISSHVIKIIMNTFLHSSYIAPVERNSIYTFSKELSLQRNILVDKILELKTEKGKDNNPFDLIERRATRYPLPIRDGLEIAEDLANYKKRISDFANFAEYLEANVLDGKIDITEDGEIQFKPNKAKSLKLPIHLTASIVKSFSSLIIYFKHLARKGDLIIIDEPELNLHPDAQIIVSRIIAKMVNKGFKVIINTHSDYIIREINNLIMLSKVSYSFEELAKEYNYSKDDILNPEEVGAYLFSFNMVRKNKVVVKNLKVSDDGFEAETIDEVISNLNSRSQDLFFRLRSTEND